MVFYGFLILVAFVIAVVTLVILKGEYEWKTVPSVVASVATFGVIALIITAFFSIKVVGANKVGILFDPLNGGVQEYTLSEGVHFISPVASLNTITTEVQSVKVENLSGQTKDSQYLNIAVDIKYKVNTGNAFSVFKNFRKLSRVNDELVVPTAQRAIETVTTNYNIIEILGSQRNNVYVEIEKELAERFEVNGVTLHSITFLDTDAGDKIEQAIVDEADAKKQVDIAEQRRKQAEIDKQTAIIEAEASKEQKILNAQAEAESIRIIQEQLSADPTYIEFIKWSAWNGALPNVMSGEGSSLLIQP